MTLPSNQVCTALIGCGKVGNTHAAALSQLPESHFLAVHDPDPHKADQIAARYRVKAFYHLEDLLHLPDLHMVSICTPNFTHADVGMACAQAGLNSLLEKPMAIDLEGCDRLIQAAAQSGVKLGVISQRRLYPPVCRMRQAILDGKIGRPILGTLTVMGWRDEGYYRMDEWRGKWLSEGGGVLLTQTTHQIDLFQWLLGQIDELFGYWDNYNHPFIEVDDTAVAVVRFRNRAVGTILLSNSQKPGFYGKIHIHGENGASVGVQTDGGSTFVSGVTQAVDPPINDIWTIPQEEHLLAGWQAEDRELCSQIDIMTYYHKLQIQDFLQAILENRSPMVPGQEGRKHVELFTAIYRSQYKNQPIKFPLSAADNTEFLDGRVSLPARAS